MTPDRGQIITLAAIVLPLAALLAVEVVHGSPGTVRRYYGRFLAFGCVHGLILWGLFVWGNWHGFPEGWVESISSVGLFLVGAVGVCLTFSVGYLASALLLRRFRRWVRAARQRG